MKKLTLIFAAMMALFVSKAQVKTDTTLSLSPFEKSKVEANSKRIQQYQKDQQEFLKFLGEYFSANAIDLNRVSLHPDSLRFEGNKVYLKLKRK